MSGRVPGVYGMLLRLAAAGVPRARRREWLEEWTAELWYVCGAVLPGPAGHAEVLRFCAGAIADAWCVRGMNGGSGGVRAGSAGACVGWMGVVAMLCVGMAQVLPGVRKAIRATPDLFVTHVVTIAPVGWREGSGPPTKLGEVRGWERRGQHLFREFGFYQTVVKVVHIGVHDAPELRVARGSANVLEMLGAKVLFGLKADEGGEPQLVLREGIWRSRFGGRREVLGRVLRVGLEPVRVVGVIADDAVPAEEQVDAWMLLPAGRAGVLPDDARVHALGRVAAGERTGDGERWMMSVDAQTERRRDYECESLFAGRMDVWRTFGLMALLALLALPATTSLPLGEYPVRDVRLGWMEEVRRWGFLCVKVGLLAAAVCFAGMDVAYVRVWAGPHTAEYLQLVTTFCGMLFGLRWCLRDQRQRCPVCLSRLTCPVRVGQPSRNFLAWHGTELMCEGGHGLLHVPELPTSWFGAPRWLHLDASWSGLFVPVG